MMPTTVLDIFMSAAWLAGRMLLVLTVLMFLLELLRAAGFFTRMARVLMPIARLFRLSEEGLFPLLVGLTFGVTYSGGVLMQVGREGRLHPQEVHSVALFLGLCHAVFEDTVLFALLGGSAAWIIGGRVVAAGVVTSVAHRWR